MKTRDNPSLLMSYKRLVAALCVAAGILYNSWPLGYVFDAPTARHGLASDLELVGHPYYWLFILGDVLTGVCIVAAVIILRYKFWPVLRSKSLVTAWLGLLSFGFFTAACSLLPYQCTITPLFKCSAGYGNGLSIDVITSSFAAFGLFVGLVSLVLEHNKSRPATRLTRLTQAIWVLWTLSGILFAILALTSGNAHFIQNVLLVASGLAAAVIGLNIASALEN